MRAAAYTYEDGSPTVAMRDLDDPTPGPTEAVVRVEACSLNHSDLWQLERAEFDDPYVAGADVAGVVEEVGADVDAVSPGDRVVRCPNDTCGSCTYCREGPENLCAEYGIDYAGFAELCVAPADRLVALPDGMSFTDAAALPIAYMTAWHMLRRGEAGPGDTVLVPGATGGVGVAAVQLADTIQATAIGTTRSPEKADRLRDLGVDHVITSDDPDEIGEEVAAIGPVDVAIDHLGGPFTGLAMDALGRDGRVVVCGRTVGPEATIDIQDLFWEHKRIVGSTMGTQPDLETLVDLTANGGLEPAIGAEYPLAETPDLIESMRDRSLFGKGIVRPQE